MPYIQNTDADRAAMLEAIGVSSVDELFHSIPEDLRLREALPLEPGLTEAELSARLAELASWNRPATGGPNFLGGGFYDHGWAAAVDELAGRSEFLTAYTPYQPEVAQGGLQAIYEWQTFICRLTGLDVANASMYDGASALGEALLLAAAQTRRRKVVVPATLNPRYRRVVGTMLRGLAIEVLEAPATAAGTLDPESLRGLATDEIAAVVIQNPNYLGCIEPVTELAGAATANGALLIAAVNPVSLSLVKSPGEYGAHVAVGEAQPLGIPACWGGPLLGFFAVTDSLKRRLPGRVVGRTVDRNDRVGYVLTLQTREQHIRREKATSNICTNQGLNALRATIYLAMLGSEGFRELGNANRVRCEALRRTVADIPGVEMPFPGPVFNETVIRLPRPAAQFRRFARQQGVLAGIDLAGFAGCGDGDLLVSVTEKRTPAQIADYGRLLREFSEGAE